MKILHLISEKPPIKSGFSRVINRLSEELVKLGHEVNVLSANDCKMKAVGEVKLILSTKALDRELRKDYDIVNIHGHTPTFSENLLLKSKLIGKKTVYTLHCLTNYYFKPISKAYNLIVNRFMLKLADAVVVTSRSYHDLLPKNLPNKYIVPWGVDYEAFCGRRIAHDDYRALFVGQMRPYKGLKVLLRAVRGLEDLTLDIVGEGPDRLHYGKYAAKLGLKRTYFHGSLSDEALRLLYLSSDVLVLPSVSVNEAFGLVTLEAAAAGCAVIASDLPGVRDVVKDFGRLVRPNDYIELRKAILEMKQKGVREKYVKRGFEAVKKYRWEKTAEKYEEIYERLRKA